MRPDSIVATYDQTSDSFRGIDRLLHMGGMGLLRAKSELRIPPGQS